MADDMKNQAITTREAHYALRFTADQEKLIRDSFLSGATREEAAVLMEVARVRGLNPITRQIHFVKRWDSTKRADVWAYQTSIDGLRAIAERTGLYDGQDEAEYGPSDRAGNPEWAKVRVYRKDVARPFVGVAHWSEFVQTKRDGGVTSMWAKFPRLMLAKCAEALAFRKAFPNDMSGLYTDDEMAQAQNEAREAQQAARREENAAVVMAHRVERPAPQSAPVDQPRTVEVAAQPADEAPVVSEFGIDLSSDGVRVATAIRACGTVEELQAAAKLLPASTVSTDEAFALRRAYFDRRAQVSGKPVDPAFVAKWTARFGEWEVRS